MKRTILLRHAAGGLFVLALTAALAIGLARPAYSMTEKELMDLYLGVVEDTIEVFEPLWVDDSARIPNSGFFDFRKYDDWTPSYKGYAGIITIPGNGLAAFCYGVLLTETDKPYFTSKKIPRAVLLDHAVKSIRWCCLTSVYSGKRYPYIYEDTAPQFLEGQYWRREFGYRADEVGFLTLAAATLWKELDPEVRKAFEEVMIGGAPKERLVRTWLPPQGGNQDQVKQDLSSTMGAAYLFPGRPDRELYMDVIRGNGIDIVSTLHDFANPTVADGKPVSEWAKGWNIYQDYTSDHHGWAQVWYGCDKLFEGWFYLTVLSRLTGLPIPETFTYPGNGFEKLLDRMKVLFLPEGDPASLHGMEYDSYYGSGLLAYCYGSVYKKDPVAAALEEKAASLLVRNSKAIREYDYHRNNWSKAALAYLAHKYAGAGAEPLDYAGAWQKLGGTFHHAWWQNVLHRTENKLASFSWGTISSPGEHFGGEGAGVCAFVIPARPASPVDEPLVYLHPLSIVGELKVRDSQGNDRVGPFPSDFYRFFRDDSGFRTVGRSTTPPVEQFMAFASFDRGPSVFFNAFRAREDCRIDWSGIPVYFYARPGATTGRAYYDAGGKRRLEDPHKGRSRWWSVNDRLGLALAEGSNEVEIMRTVGRNWARTDAYKDKCDTIYVSPVRDAALKAGDVCGRTSAVLFTEAPRGFIEGAAKGLGANALDLPAGWVGIVVPESPGHENRLCLAVANFFGGGKTWRLALSFRQGAPVSEKSTLIKGKRGWMDLDLGPVEVFSETLDFYLETSGLSAVTARRLQPGRYEIKPVDADAGTQVRLRYYGRTPGNLQVKDLSGRLIKEFPAGGPVRGEGILLDVGKGISVVDRSPEETDFLGPAVEIRNLQVREDGRVSVQVEANDQSGIRSVRLYRDGRLIGERAQEPWTWSLRPGKGWHTFFATAADDSPRGNERKSDSRTIRID